MARGRGRGRGSTNNSNVRGQKSKQVPRERQGAQLSASPGFGGQTIRLRDAETLPLEKSKYKNIKFTPGKTGFARLDSFGKMYTQFTVHSVSVAWVSQASTMQAGVVSYGVSPGNSKDFNTHALIQKLRPMRSVAIWKSESITLGRNVMQQPWMNCESADGEDGVAFSIHALADEALGYLKVTYDIELRYPHP